MTRAEVSFNSLTGLSRRSRTMHDFVVRTFAQGISCVQASRRVARRGEGPKASLCGSMVGDYEKWEEETWGFVGIWTVEGMRDWALGLGFCMNPRMEERKWPVLGHDAEAVRLNYGAIPGKREEWADVEKKRGSN